MEDKDIIVLEEGINDEKGKRILCCIMTLIPFRS